MFCRKAGAGHHLSHVTSSLLRLVPSMLNVGCSAARLALGDHLLGDHFVVTAPVTLCVKGSSTVPSGMANAVSPKFTVTSTPLANFVSCTA